MGVSTTHRINLSMWILIYSFSDTYYVWAACVLNELFVTAADQGTTNWTRLCLISWLVARFFYFKFVQSLQHEITQETAKLRLDSVEQETNFHDFNLLLV